MRRRLAATATLAAAAVLAFPAAASAAAPTVTMDPAGILAPDGRSVTVSGTYRCDPVPPGGAEKLYLQVTQTTLARKAALGGITVVCTGLPQTYVVTLPTISTGPLLPGAAVGSATIAGSSGSGNNSPGTVMVLA